ncbi:hypothetical protein EV426DRAFT_352449 [Tirmania nivea]|nr:hypothetical protein EV426DRAFT_352449 [Tirmania nivea]
MEIPHQPSIASFYQQSIDRFECVCRLLENPSYQNSHKNMVPLLSDELGRLRVWAGNCGAHRMPNDKLSLDHRLREASHIQKRVRELLAELIDNLKDAIEMLVSVSETITCSANHIEHYSDSDSDSSISASPIQGESVEEPATDIEYVVSNTTHIITCLYNLSMIIQSPAPRDRLHKSQAIPIAHFLPYEKQHMQDKFPQAPTFLVERLARANVARRQLLKYFQRLHDNNMSSALETPGPLVNCVDRKKEGTISTALNSQTTISAYIAADPLSLAEVESKGGTSGTSFASSSSSMGGLYVPRAPSLLNDAPFQCPYCFLIIRPKNTGSWLRHIFKDLKPYICTFEDCAMPERLFCTRQAWYEHEIKYHRKHWLCRMCSISFNEGRLLEEHLRAYHHTANDIAHVFIEHCEIPVGTAQICPLCPTVHSLVKLRSHLAYHLQELALFALPRVDLGESLESRVSHSTQELQQVDIDIDFQSPFGSTKDSNSTTGSEPRMSVEHIKVPGEVVSEATKEPLRHNIAIRHLAGLVVDKNVPKPDVIDPKLLTYSPLGNSSKDTQEDDEDTPQAVDANPQNAISHLSLGDLSKDTEIVINRQRKVKKGRPGKNRYLCGFFSEECEYMDNKAGFENCAKLKEDALRHINGFQCPTCGKRFGKRYGLQRHCKLTKCTKGEFDEVHCELKRWMDKLEAAKGYDEVKFAIDQCKKYCDINTNCQKQHPQQKEERECQAPQVANAPEIRSITPTDSEASVNSHISNGTISDLLQQEEGLVDAGGHEFASAQQMGAEVSASNILGQDNFTADSYRGYPQSRSTYVDITGMDEYSG